MQISQNAVNIREIVQILVISLRQAMEDKHLHFHYSLNHVTMPLVKAEADELEKLFREILRNAIARAQDGGEVNLSVTQLLHSGSETTLEVAVQDNGDAVVFPQPVNLRSAAGDHLRQIRRRIPERWQHIAGRLNGKVSCESGRGAGNVVRVIMTLPVDEKAETPSQDVSQEIYNFTGKTVLLAEDHPLSQDQIAEMLERVGIGVETASDGNEAVRLFRERGGDYDLILMDTRMPVMNGIEAVRFIRAYEVDGEHLPIIALASRAYDGDVRKSFEAGMDGAVRKPVDPEKMYKTLSRFLFP